MPESKGAWERQFPLMQSKAEIGKDWTKRTGKTAIAIGDLESKHTGVELFD